MKLNNQIKNGIISVEILLLIVISLMSSILFAQENMSCEKFTDTLTNIVIYKNTKVKAAPVIGQEEMSMNLRPMLSIQDQDYDAHGIFDKTLIAGFIVSPEGNIIGERIIKSSDIDRLDSLYLTSLKKFKWKPGKCRDLNVNSWVEFKVMLYKRK